MAASMFGTLSYELQWRTQLCTEPSLDFGPWSLATDSLTSPMVKKKNLQAGVIYAFRVRAKHSMGWGAYSVPVVFHAQNAGHEQYPVYSTLDVTRVSKRSMFVGIWYTMLNAVSGGLFFGFHLYMFPYH